MKCPAYRCIMVTARCLEYQSKAAGTWKAKNSGGHSANALLHIWQIKYKPCLTCPTGAQARAGKTTDGDVEELKAQANQTQTQALKRCITCNLEKPADASHFHRNRTTKDGLASSCKDCMREIQSKSYHRLKALKTGSDIEQSAPNIAPIIDNTAMEKQSMTENSNNIKAKDIDQMQPNPDITSNNLVDMSPGKIKVLKSTRTCKRCSYQGPDADFHHIGPVPSNVCRTCTKAKRAETQANRPPMTNGQQVLLDFSNYPEIKEALEADAKKNFRTINNEILFRLVNHG